MYRDLTKGSIIRGLLLFALPMIAGNLLQQLYNIADTLIVGQALGRNALAAVGSAYTLMTFLTSIFLGLSMGSGALFSIALGKKDEALLRSAVGHAFGLILAVTVVLNVLVYAFLDAILRFLQIPQELYGQMREYLVIIFAGLLATFLYNFFACLLRAAGNSVAPLCFLGLSAGLEHRARSAVRAAGSAGALRARQRRRSFRSTSPGIGLTVYTALRCRGLLPDIRSLRFDRQVLADILDMSLLTCAQQSAMNFGILLIQRLVDSFGPVTMAAFAAAVKIDSFAYLPVQDFGNAFSTFVAQNYGAGQRQRIRRGFRDATLVSAGFSALHFPARVRVRAAADADLRAGRRGGGAGGGRAVSADRGRVLCGHRVSVFALRVLPRGEAAGDVGGADGHLARRARGAGVSAGRTRRRGRHLGGDPDRVGAGGCDGIWILSAAQGEAAAGGIDKAPLAWELARRSRD